MADLSVQIDVNDIIAKANRLAQMDDRLILKRAINHTGDKAKTAVIKSLTQQTGLKRKIIVKALKVRRATGGSEQFVGRRGDARLSYTLSTRGGDISLKYFDAKETSTGVSAAPGGKRITFAGAFIRGGKPGHRVWVKKLGGHVFKREGRHRLKIIKQVSDINIPDQMVQGATKAAFESIVNRDLAVRIEHEIDYALQTGGF